MRTLPAGVDGDGSEDEDEEEEERQDQMSRVAVTLVALAEAALGGGRFPTSSLSEDVKRLKQLGPEQPGEARVSNTASYSVLRTHTHTYVHICTARVRAHRTHLRPTLPRTYTRRLKASGDARVTHRSFARGTAR